jgi:hypothetical protein
MQHQRKLTSLFQRITADDAAQQRRKIALKWEEEHPLVAAAAAAAAAQPLKRGPGRPPKKRELAVVDDTDGAAQPHSKKPRTGAHTNWFSSPRLLDILQALRQHGFSAKRTVAALQRSAPDGRYNRLSDSTIRAWFVPGTSQLLPRFQSQLEEGTAHKRSSGRPPAMTTAIEEEIKGTLLKLRDAGMPVNSHVIRWSLQAVFKQRDPSLLESLQMSQQWISYWVRTKLKWRWRARTTTASKLPIDWEEQGVLMAKRIAAQMEMHEVHPSLVINMDQTGVNLVPAAAWTYEKEGRTDVATLGAEDKRQITACLASSLYGDLLPLQLIFAGKTERCLPAATAASKSARAHITCSPNHWSSQQTMQQWITEVLMPYADRCIRQHQLNADAKIILVLDVWAVHKSEEFRLFLRTHHPRVRLVFVPANCTSKLQVADVALQRPFKSSIRRSFDTWAAEQLYQQISSERVVGLAEQFKMVNIKPLILQWCINSWQHLQQRKDIIAAGWYSCCTSLYDVNSRDKRVAALSAVAQRLLDDNYVPDGEEDVMESDGESDSEVEDEEGALSDGSGEELDLAAPLPANVRRSERKRKQASSKGYMFNSQNIALTEDSEA